MGHYSNKITEFEETYWQDLAEKFIKKYESQWMDFISEHYDQYKMDLEED